MGPDAAPGALSSKGGEGPLEVSDLAPPHCGAIQPQHSVACLLRLQEVSRRALLQEVLCGVVRLVVLQASPRVFPDNHQVTAALLCRGLTSPSWS